MLKFSAEQFIRFGELIGELPDVFDRLLKRVHPKRTSLSNNQLLMAKSVEHLGVRIRWIDDWPKLPHALREMLELPSVE